MATRPASAARRTAAKRVKFLLNTFLVVCAEGSTALSMLFIGMYPSSEFEFGSDVAFGLLQADQSSATATTPHGHYRQHSTDGSYASCAAIASKIAARSPVLVYS